MRNFEQMKRRRCLFVVGAGLSFLLAWVLFFVIGTSGFSAVGRGDEDRLAPVFSVVLGLVVLAGGLWAAFYLLRSHEHLDRLISEWFCPQCGYDLQELTSGDCPECGRSLAEYDYRRGGLPLSCIW